MTDSYSQSQAPPSSAPFGSSMTDLISTQKGGVQNLSNLVLGLVNAFRPATASSCPIGSGVNTLGTSAAVVIAAANINRHGILLSNVGLTAVVYVYPTAIATTPTLASTGGALPIAAGSTVYFPSAQFPNFNCGLSAFAGTGTNNPFTVWEFY